MQTRDSGGVVVMHSLIIHLPSARARQPNVARLLNVLPNAQVMEAVRGADALQVGAVSVRDGDLYSPRYPFALSAGEVGCFLSHRACWQRIVDEGWDYALIVEDDFHAEGALWADTLRLIEAHAGTQIYLRLPAKDREHPSGPVIEQGQSRLFLPRRIGLQTVAQVVGREAAARLLAVGETIDRPVDALLQMHWVTGQRVHTILPNGVQELTAALGGSTIQSKPPKSGQFMRELKRLTYRLRVALCPQRAKQDGPLSG